ncbi:PREDICTED: uncharacterized protein LOC108515149 isoform X2 [Rhinopithecus bieti]|uniref:uncharacterized protein LOC108515149 isoform X2 n=1 Tax=Rhinopithecus bieti TaxID=61621 RepID=UPI00083BFA29|nr:PREDICTED: uncharacterized protein LOC108515149 isoform X2 [Rhinopithecus bieti]
MRLSVRAPRSARPELFVNYISGSFIAPEPRATEKPPPPPQTASRTPGAPASRRPSCNDNTKHRPGGLGLSDPGCGARKGGGNPSPGGKRPPRGPADGVPGVRNLPPNPHHVSIFPKKKQVKVAMRWPASQVNDFGSARRRMEVRPKEELSTCYGRVPGARRRGQPSPGQGTSHRSWICFSSSVSAVGPSPQPQSWT